MSWEIRQGHVLTRLAELADESVHCVVTSPPFYGLRDYGTAVWDGGREDCDHIASELRKGVNLRQSAASTRGGAIKIAEVGGVPYRDVCGKCGARRVDEQIGLEATPDEYLDRLVAVFREVRRVLRRDGVCWLNIGDSYCSAPSGPGNAERPMGWDGAFKVPSLERREASRGRNSSRPAMGKHAGVGAGIPAEQPNRRRIDGVKPKDLLLIPARLSLALQADGWWVRSEVVWSKPNPMPESVEDRPTSAHEKVFMLVKSERYFYDHVAVREPSPPNERRRGAGPSPVRVPTERDVEKLSNGHNRTGYAAQRGEVVHGTGRNRRNVWEVATVAFPEAHFAVFPPKLVEPAVLAGSSPKVCGVCAAPWRRMTERVPTGYDGARYGERAVQATGGAVSGGTERSTLGSSNGTETAEVRTLGWEATCGHGDDSGRAVVLDPFAGSGTVGVVCEWHGRDFIGLELNEDYARMARRRIAAEGPLGRPARRPRSLPGDHATLFDL